MSEQLSLKLPLPLPRRAFDGETYDAQRDHERLTGQLHRVLTIMRDGNWRTLQQIATVAAGTEPSVSARLRDLRKPKYGSHTIERRHVSSGLWQYRMAS